MGLAMISEAVTEICAKEHSFTDKEKEFIVQFAFKTGDRELTDKLIDELVAVTETVDSEQIIQKYSALYGVKPVWVNQIENLLVSIEMYRLEEEKAINRLAEILDAYGIEVTDEPLRSVDAEENKEKVQESQKDAEQEEEQKKKEETQESQASRYTLRDMAL